MGDSPETFHSPAPDSAPSEELLAHVQQAWDRIKPNSAIYTFLLSNVRLVRATRGRVVAHLPLEPVHLNSKQILHGAVSATVTDWAGGMAIASMGLTHTGVSTDIHVTYASTAHAGDTLEIDAWVTRAGKTMAFTQVDIRKFEGHGVKGATVASGSHTKFLNFGLKE